MNTNTKTSPIRRIGLFKPFGRMLVAAVALVFCGALPASAAKIFFPDANLGAGGSAGAVGVVNFPVLTTWGNFSCTAVLLNCPGSGIAGDPFPLGTAGNDYSAVGKVAELLIPATTVQMYVTNVTITADPGNAANVTGEISVLSDLIFPLTAAGLPAGIFLKGSFIGAAGGAPNAADSLTASMEFSNGVNLDPTQLSDTTVGQAPFTLSDAGRSGGQVADLEGFLDYTLAPGDSISLPGSLEVEDNGALGEEAPEPASFALFGLGLFGVGFLRRKRA